MGDQKHFHFHGFHDVKSAVVFERLNFKIDIQRLQAHFEEFVRPLPSAGQPRMFGGWSALSSTGSYLDGWHSGHVSKNERPISSEEERKRFAQANQNPKRSRDYTVPTEICHSYLAEVLQKMSDVKLHPSRARIIRLAGKTTSFQHRDETDDGYAVRLHLPILTNEHCYFETETERAHLPADGSLYLLFVNRIHWVSNEGTSDRFHLVIDVRDLDGVSRFHQFDPIKFPKNTNFEATLPQPLRLIEQQRSPELP